jgi:hypothetical protein
MGMVALGLGAGCGLSEKECTALRGEAYDVLNQAHTCNNDVECLPSEWPGCQKPVSKKSHEKIKGLWAKFQGGRCQEPAADCRPPPEIYCKQGLCVTRELAAAAAPK